jgi:hypothetical protein
MGRMRQYQAPGSALTAVEPLPFIPAGLVPPCTRHPHTYNSAGEEPRTEADRPETTAAREMAVQICNACPVLNGCRSYALRTRQPWGVWGGLLPREREDVVRHQYFRRDGRRVSFPRERWVEDGA